MTRTSAAVRCLGFLLPLALIGCAGLQPATPTPETDLWEAWDQTYVSVTGRVVPVHRAELAFAMPGRVVEVLVAEGEPVEPGQLLARLEDAQLQAAVAQAEAGVAQAEAQLAKLRAGARPEQVAVAEAGVSQARAAVGTSEMAIAAAEAQAAIAQSALWAAQAQLNQVRAGPTEEEIEIARQQVELAKAQRYAAQSQRDAVGGLRDAAPNSTYDLGVFQAAEGQAFAAENQVTIAELQYELVKQGARPEQIAVVEAQVAQARASWHAAQVAVEVAGGQHEAALAALEQAEAQGALVQAPPTHEDLALAQAGVAQAQAALEQALAALSQAHLTSPIAGTIAQVNLRPGDMVAAGIAVISVGSLDAFEIETTDMDEIDAARIQVGDRVELLFDALPELEATGIVRSIALKAGAGLGGTAYKVVIALDDQAEGLRWGMTASVDIVLGSAD